MQAHLFTKSVHEHVHERFMNMFMNTCSLSFGQCSWTSSEHCCSWTPSRRSWIFRSECHDVIPWCGSHTKNLRILTFSWFSYGEHSKVDFLPWIRLPFDHIFDHNVWTTFFLFVFMNNCSWNIHELFMNLFMNTCSLRFGHCSLLVHEQTCSWTFIYVHVHQEKLSEQMSLCKSHLQSHISRAPCL